MIGLKSDPFCGAKQFFPRGGAIETDPGILNEDVPTFGLFFRLFLIPEIAEEVGARLGQHA